MSIADLSEHKSIVVLSLFGVVLLLLAALSSGTTPTGHTQSAVTMTPPPTWTGGVPTADWTPNPDTGPDVDSSFWDATSTLQWSGLVGTPTVPPTP